ncbi:MAG: adenylate/guanylate cyclase domain-containing protein [Oscillospiraceae bacterium]|nr:adenylate/guanylate cyclase domain-containing protein [Oscillospiraceae bacterium]MCL2278522.1 adenylate/guanylate cyclase domain-containing protein [Oscillospiraceae bacterium]
MTKIKKYVSIAVAAFLLLIFIAANPLWMLEYRVRDIALQRPGLLHPDIIVVGIDEFTLAQFGTFWHWSRPRAAEAINILNSDPDGARPAVIGVDILFSEQGLIEEHDLMLVDAVRDFDNVVLASSLEIGDDPERMLLDTVIGYRTPFPALLPYVSHGLVNGIFDRDGFLRDALLWERYHGEKLYSFPVVVAMKYLGITEPDPFIRENAEMFLRYTGEPGDFFWFSFAEIFEPDFDPWIFDGAIVLIGPYALGMMDHYPVPIQHGTPMYGVEILANVTQAILDEAFKVRAPAWANHLVVAAFIVLGMLVSELVTLRRTLIIFPAAAVAYYFSALAIFNRGVVLPLLIPPLMLGIVLLYQFTYQYLLQAAEKSRLRTVFGKYVAPELVNTLIKSGEADADASERKKHIAVIFVDVRGFTSMTENLRDSPEHIVRTLNAYLELTSTAVFNHGGSVDKFIGDATMALFNGFMPLDDYVYKAVCAAWEMTLGAEKLNQSLKERFGVDLSFGIGVHCGEAIVGNLGPSFRKDYTAIGDTVNTAARLEANAAPSEVLISRDIYDLLGDRIEAKPMGKIPLKGKSEPIEVFSLTNLTFIT